MQEPQVAQGCFWRFFVTDIVNKVGTIETVSVQGHNYFAAIRYDGEAMQDMMGNPVRCGRYLAGIPFWTPEATATMAELLIPLNINSTLQVTDPKLMVGARCIVHLKGENGKADFPISATITGDDNSRIVDREFLWESRQVNGDGIFDSKTKKIIDAGNTISSSKLDELLGETYDVSSYKGMVVVYGDNQDPFRTSTKDMSDLVDMSSKQDKNNILGISTRSLRTKECYTPATVFTGRT